MVEGKQSSFMRVVETDNLRKREQFAVSLRNQKRKKIIQAKRKRLPTCFVAGAYSTSASHFEVTSDHSMGSSEEGQSPQPKQTELDLIHATAAELEQMLSETENSLAEKEKNHLIMKRLEEAILTGE